MAGAAFHHARTLAAHGPWWDYGGIHPFYAAFRTSLTFLDTLAVALLFLRPRAGLALTAVIIVADVLVNASVAIIYGIDWLAFGAQALFLVFVLATIGPPGAAWGRVFLLLSRQAATLSAKFARDCKLCITFSRTLPIMIFAAAQ